MLGRIPGTEWPERSYSQSQQSFFVSTSELWKVLVDPESEICCCYGSDMAKQGKEDKSGYVQQYYGKPWYGRISYGKIDKWPVYDKERLWQGMQSTSIGQSKRMAGILWQDRVCQSILWQNRQGTYFCVLRAVHQRNALHMYHSVWKSLVLFSNFIFWHCSLCFLAEYCTRVASWVT